jgi:hypothetical protein
MNSSGIEENNLHASMDFDIDAQSVKGGRGSEMNRENIELKNEARKTSVIRCLVITTLLTCAAIVANVALIMVLNDEEVHFKSEYRRLSMRLIDRFHESLSEKILATDSMAAQIAFGDDVSQPYLFSIPEFEIQAEGLRELSTSMTVSYSPFLRGEQEREEFEAFAISTYDDQARSSFKDQYLPHDAKYNFKAEPLMTYVDTGGRSVQDGIYRVVNGVSVADDESSVYAPVWQVSISFRWYQVSAVDSIYTGSDSWPCLAGCSVQRRYEGHCHVQSDVGSQAICGAWTPFAKQHIRHL